MTKTNLFLACALILAGSTQVFAGSGQNGPIGPGSRYGLQPGPDVAATGSGFKATQKFARETRM
jgi:hypothetical protein